MSVMLSIFWGLLLFSGLVFIHEGGHYLAARLFGVRVLEFFIGMPSKRQWSFSSKRCGTKFGITPYLLGGYAKIAGMDLGKQYKHTASILNIIYMRGSISIAELSYLLKADVEDVVDSLQCLENWGSIKLLSYQDYQDFCEQRGLECASNLLLDRQSDQLINQLKEDNALPFAALTLARDRKGNTRYDRANLAELNESYDGAAYISPHGADAFFQQEKMRSYAGLHLFGRLVVLSAGILVNVLFAILIFCAIFVTQGIDKPSLSIDYVEPGSKAAEIDLKPGDLITAINMEPVSDWSDFQQKLAEHKDGNDFKVSYIKQGGSVVSASVRLQEGEILGVRPVLEHIDLSMIESLQLSLRYCYQTATAIFSLLTPQGFSSTLDQSGSVIAIAVMAKDAARAGFMPFVSLAAAISLSLGFMNLLPIPPLDGGKIVIECIQGIIGRPLPEASQTVVSILGFVLIFGLFIYLMGQDIARLLLGL